MIPSARATALRSTALATSLALAVGLAAFPLDAVTTIGRDVNNGIVVDDPFASADHAVLTFRGRAWYVEDLSSTNGSYVNGIPVEGIAEIGFGDELQVGEVRLRLDRGRP